MRSSKKKTKKSSLQKQRAKQRALQTKDWDQRREAKLRKADKKLSAKDGGPRNRCKEKTKLFCRRIGCVPPKKLPLSGPPAELAQYLKFTHRELAAFQLAFDEVDLDGTKEIDYDELLEMLGESRSPYTDALFSVIDDQQTGAMDIQNFFYLIATYSMYKEEEVYQFVFQTFDKDCSGQIDEEEFLDLARTVNNAEPLFPGNFKTALEQFDQNDDGLLDFKEFKEINEKFPMVFYPAFKLQDKFQSAVLGRDFWTHLMKYLTDKANEDDYIEKHDGQRPPISCNEKFQRKLFCLFECCRGPRWRAFWDPNYGGYSGAKSTVDASGNTTVLRKKRKKGQSRKQRSSDRNSKRVHPQASSAWGESPTSPQRSPSNGTAQVQPLTLTKKEKLQKIQPQRITATDRAAVQAW